MSEENPIDTVNLEIPLLIRLFEYSREDATSDQDLHVVAENLVKLSKEGPLGMSVYDKVVPKKEEPKTETTVAGDVAGKDVSLFQGKDKIAKIKSVAEAVAAVLEGESTLDISDTTTPENFAKEFDDRAGTSFSLWGEEPQWKKLMDAWNNGQKITIVYSEKEKKEKEVKGFKLVASGSGGPGNEEYILAHPHSKYAK